MASNDESGIFRPWNRDSDKATNSQTTLNQSMTSPVPPSRFERREASLLTPMTSPRAPVPLHPALFETLLRQMQLQTMLFRAHTSSALAMTSLHRPPPMTQPVTRVTHRKPAEAEVRHAADDVQPIDLTVRANARAPEKHTPPFPLPLPSDGEPLDLLPQSMYLHQSQGGGHLCVFCGKVYSRKYGLKIHLRTHTGYKPLKCKVCSRQFGDPSNLNKHIRLHAEGATPYRCPHCGKVLVRKRDLDRHVRSRHPEAVTPLGDAPGWQHDTARELTGRDENV